MGLEPTRNSDGTKDDEYGCDFCQGFRAARALHAGSPLVPGWRRLTPICNASLLPWGMLPEAIRRAVTALIGFHNT